jgi:hypothetical protein
MGRRSYSVEGSGMTVEEARRNALESDREERGHQDGYSGGFAASTGDSDRVECLVAPVAAKRATFTRSEKRGPIKWETRYVANDYFSGKRVVSERTQGACVKLAQEYSAKHNVILVIEVEKIVASGSQHLGKVCPGRSVVGRWRFSGEARC